MPEQSSEQSSERYERLLGEWNAHREVVNAYHRALRLLTPDYSEHLETLERSERGEGPAWDVGHREQREQQRRAVTHKLANALLALRHASDQLDSAEHERAGARAP